MSISDGIGEAKLEQYSNYYTYCWLYACAENAIDLARAAELGRTHHCMTSNMFSTLTVEAYFNHLGDRCCKQWELVEPKLSPRDKLQYICADLGLKIDIGKRPFQCLGRMLDFRNDVAHGKSVAVYGDHGRGFDWPQPAWLEECCLPVAEEWFTSARKMVEGIARQVDADERPFAVLSEGFNPPLRRTSKTRANTQTKKPKQ